jgi:integrase
MIHEIQLESSSPALNGTHLQTLIDAFLADRKKRNQIKTVRGYRFKLRPFCDWWQQVGPGCDWVLSADDLPAYEQYLQSLGWGWTSRTDALKRLRQMFRWAHQTGRIAVDFSLFVPKTKGGKPVKLPMTLDELANLLKICWKMNHPLRNRAIIAVLAGTGLRREECASLQVENVTMFDDGAGYLSPPITKNDTPRLVAFDSATGEYIRQWLDVLGSTPGPLFPSRKGGSALSPDGLYKVVLDAAKLAGIVVGTHDFRRMFATVWSKHLRGEAYGQLLQKQLGHANYATTAIYALQQIDDVLEVMREVTVSPIALLQK